MLVRVRAGLMRQVAVVAVLSGALALPACGSESGPRDGAGTRTTTSSRVTPSSSATSTTAPGTQEVEFDPFSPQGALRAPLVVSHTVSGSCVSSGVAGAASYRCFGGQPQAGIYDPCFAPPTATSGPLVCVADPTTSNVVEFDTGPLPSAPVGTPPTRPWAVRLLNGQVCVLVDAAWGGLGPFACPIPGATSSVADCHVPTQGTPWWTTACQPEENPSSPFAEDRITMLWT